MPTKQAIHKLRGELPGRCDCGSENLNIWGTRIEGRVRIDVRCMRCGKILWDMKGKNEG